MNKNDLAGLLDDAAENGDITAETVELLSDADTLQQIRRGDGVDPDNYPHSAVRILTILLDDSGSIAGPNTQVVIDGHNMIIEALRGSSKKQQQETIVSCRCLNSGVVYPYKYLADVPLLDNSRFCPEGSTPLYEMSVVAVGGAVVKVKEFEEKGISARTWTLIVTDGANYPDCGRTAADVKTVVQELNGEQHVVLAMGVTDGKTDFRGVFMSMGVKEKNILLADGRDGAAIRRQFNVASQSASAMNTVAQGSSSGRGLLG